MFDVLLYDLVGDTFRNSFIPENNCWASNLTQYSVVDSCWAETMRIHIVSTTPVKF